MTLHDNLRKLTDDEIFRLVEELKQVTVPDDALIRQVIKGTEVDTTVPMLAFIAVQGTLSFVLAEKFKCALDIIKILQGRHE